MPSKSALVIEQKLEQYLGRALTQDESLKTEELNINWYTSAVCSYIDGMMRKGAPKDFDLVYTPIMNGLLRGAYRRRDIIKITGRFREVYLRLHQLTGDGMTNGELESVIFLAESCTNKEIDAAIAVARARGVSHVNYIRAVIEGNRKAASRAHAAKDFKQFVPNEYGKKEAIGVPRVDAIREGWLRKIADAKEKIELSKAELNAKRKLKDR